MCGVSRKDRIRRSRDSNALGCAESLSNLSKILRFWLHLSTWNHDILEMRLEFCRSKRTGGASSTCYPAGVRCIRWCSFIWGHALDVTHRSTCCNLFKQPPISLGAGCCNFWCCLKPRWFQVRVRCCRFVQWRLLRVGSDIPRLESCA